MSPVDSIRPPKRAKRFPTTHAVPAPAKTVLAAKKPPTPEEPAKKTAANPTLATASQKQKTIIMVVTVIMALIFIGWVALFMSGNLTRSGTSNFGSALSNQFKRIWENIKSDVLKIKNVGQNTNTANVNEEQIKKLENSVFPQFNDPTKQ